MVSGTTWSVYRTVKHALAAEPGLSTANPVFELVAHPSGIRSLTPGAASSYAGETRAAVPPSPALGADTDAVLAECLGLSSQEIGRLRAAGIVAAAQ